MSVGNIRKKVLSGSLKQLETKTQIDTKINLQVGSIKILKNKTEKVVLLEMYKINTEREKIDRETETQRERR